MSLPLILASESPRRQELLAQAGIAFTAVSSHAEEVNTGDPIEVVEGNAISKARAVKTLYPAHVILGADTIVCLDGHIFGKPADEHDAFRMIQALSGQWHKVYTGVAIIDQNGRLYRDHDVTDVHFTLMTEKEIAEYIHTGEPFGKAGAYAIQGKAGYFIDRINGSFSNVIGLPLTKVRDMLGQINNYQNG